jgi:hypothetical protein
MNPSENPPESDPMAPLSLADAEKRLTALQACALELLARATALDIMDFGALQN